MSTLTYTDTLVVESCPTCGVVHGIPDVLYRKAKADHRREIYCPNGHTWHYTGETDAERERRLRKWAEDSPRPPGPERTRPRRRSGRRRATSHGSGSARPPACVRSAAGATSSTSSAMSPTATPASSSKASRDRRDPARQQPRAARRVALPGARRARAPVQPAAAPRRPVPGLQGRVVGRAEGRPPCDEAGPEGGGRVTAMRDPKREYRAAAAVTTLGRMTTIEQRFGIRARGCGPDRAQPPLDRQCRWSTRAVHTVSTRITTRGREAADTHTWVKPSTGTPPTSRLSSPTTSETSP